jgi:NAD(P)H-dependent FMN reductase
LVPHVRLLLISGSTRNGSTNTALLRTAARLADDAVLADGIDVLPHFNPDLDHAPLPAAVDALRRAVASADALLVSTPEYAGTLPGSFKNLLDWLVGGTEITDKPIAWVNVAAESTRGAGATATLETVLGYVGARIVADACAHIPVRRDAVTADGLVDDSTVLASLQRLLVRLGARSSPRPPATT